jgi:hypothetical protein
MNTNNAKDTKAAPLLPWRCLRHFVFLVFMIPGKQSKANG